MNRIAGLLLAGLMLAASGGIAGAEVLTTPGYSERDTPADLPQPEGSRKLDMMLDVQAQAPNAQNGQTGSGNAGSNGSWNGGARQLPGRLRYRVH